MDQTGVGESVTNLAIRNCESVSKTPFGQTVHYVRCAININSLAMIDFLEIANTTIDWSDAEGPGYSWHYTGAFACPLVKIQNAKTVEFRKCEFLHGGNKEDTDKECYTLKTDRIRPENLARGAADGSVTNLNILDCEFSGPVLLAYEPHELEWLRVKGSAIQKHGNFNAPYAFNCVNYRNVYVTDSDQAPAIRTTVDHVRDGGGVIRLYDQSWSADWKPQWEFNRMVVSAEAGATRGCFFIRGGPGIETPRLSDLKHHAGFRRSNTCLNPSGSFWFSDSDPTRID
jgi:hypothetical protein